MKNARGLESDQSTIDNTDFKYFDLIWEAPTVKLFSESVNFIPLNIDDNQKWEELQQKNDGTRIFIQKNTSAFVEGFHYFETLKKTDEELTNYLWRDYLDSNIFLVTCEKQYNI